MEAKSWEEYFSEFNYKPNWEFIYIYEIEYNTHKLHIVMRVPNARTPLPKKEFNLMGAKEVVPLFPISRTIHLPRWFGERDANNYLRFLISQMEDHEMDEWFCYKGELIFDPHKEENNNEF